MKPSAWQKTFIGIVLLLSITMILLMMQTSISTRSRQAQSPISPLITILPATEAPLPHITWVPTNEPNSQAGQPIPTETTAPTLTSQPTATPRPGATATPFSTRSPATNPSGEIFYTQSEQRDIFTLSVNREGKILAEAEKLPTLPFSDLALADASPDGKYLLVMQVSVGHATPYVYNRITGETKRVLSEENSTIGQYFGWHPDSHHLLFGQLGIGLGIVDVETDVETMLGNSRGTLQGAAISPDGQSVIYIADSDLSPQSLWKAETSGHGAEILLGEGGPGYVFGWSPLGDQILTLGGGMPDASRENQGPLGLWDTEGKNLSSLNAPFITGFGHQPMWSPNGEWIAFAGLTEGTDYGCAKQEPAPEWPQCQFAGTILYIVNPITGELRALGNGIQPAWSPDGSMLAFIGYQNDIQNLWMVDVEGNRLQQLTYGEHIIHAVWTTAIP